MHYHNHHSWKPQVLHHIRNRTQQHHRSQRLPVLMQQRHTHDRELLVYQASQQEHLNQPQAPEQHQLHNHNQQQRLAQEHIHNRQQGLELAQEHIHNRQQGPPQVLHRHIRNCGPAFYQSSHLFGIRNLELPQEQLHNHNRLQQQQALQLQALRKKDHNRNRPVLDQPFVVATL